MAILFFVSFVFMGVGSSSVGNVFSSCNGSNEINSSSSFEDREEYYLNKLEENPEDDAVMLQLATLYGDESVGRYSDAITYLNMYVELNPGEADARIRIADIYLSNLGDTAAAVDMLNQATQIDPNNSTAFLKLGVAAKQAGQNQVAIMAWSRYLELQPNSPNADDIRQEIEKLSTQPAASSE